VHDGEFAHGELDVRRDRLGAHLVGAGQDDREFFAAVARGEVSRTVDGGRDRLGDAAPRSANANTCRAPSA